MVKVIDSDKKAGCVIKNRATGGIEHPNWNLIAKCGI